MSVIDLDSEIERVKNIPGILQSEIVYIDAYVQLMKEAFCRDTNNNIRMRNCVANKDDIDTGATITVDTICLASLPTPQAVDIMMRLVDIERNIISRANIGNNIAEVSKSNDMSKTQMERNDKLIDNLSDIAHNLKSIYDELRKV